MFKPLTPSEWLHDSCESEGFSYYTATVEHTAMEVIFTLKSVEPEDDSSDPDLYISLKSFPNKETYQWKSTLFGPDTVALLPSDPLYLPGEYKISIFNSKPSKYRLKFFFLQVPREVNYPYVDSITEPSYFKYKVEHPGNSRIEITLDPPSAVFVSFTTERPGPQNHTYSQGLYRSTAEYLEIDPFPAFPLSFVSFVSQDLDRVQDPQFSRLCVDSEEKNRNLYITVFPKNFPFTFQLNIIEIQTECLVPDSLKSLFSVFFSAFHQTDTNFLSLNDRKANSLEYNLEFTYGEIEFFSYIKVLELVHPAPGETIWDLGSGAGKSLLAAALAYPDSTVIGVEYLPELCAFSRKVTRDLPNVQVIQGDIKEQDWSGAGVIYMSSLCFLDELLEKIVEKCRTCKIGTRAISLKEFPPTSEWVLTYSLRTLMSWGRSTCMIYKKIS